MPITAAGFLPAEISAEKISAVVQVKFKYNLPLMGGIVQLIKLYLRKKQNMLRKFIIQVVPAALVVVLKLIRIKKNFGLLKYN